MALAEQGGSAACRWEKGKRRPLPSDRRRGALEMRENGTSCGPHNDRPEVGGACPV